MPKHTKLDENAEIYKTRSEKSEREKLRNMRPKERLDYLWEYYRIHALVTIGVIALLSYIIYTVATPDVKPQFYAALINNTVTEEELQQYREEFSEYLQLDPKKDSVEFNSSFYMNDSFDSMNSKQVLMAYVAAQEIDVIIAPESEFSNYAFSGFFDKLSEQLPTNVYSSLTDHFYLTGTDDDPDQNAYGVYLTDTKLYKNKSVDGEPYVLGIVANAKHKENALEFINYLFHE